MYLLYVKIWNSSKFQFPCILFARDIHVHPGFISRDSYRGFYAFIFYTVNVYMSRIHSYIAYIYNIIPYRAYAKRGTPSFHLSFFHYYYYIFFIPLLWLTATRAHETWLHAYGYYIPVAYIFPGLTRDTAPLVYIARRNIFPGYYFYRPHVLNLLHVHCT